MAAAGDLELTAAVQVGIAVQACLPVLNLGLDWYRGWRSIIVYPSQFLVPRAITDDSGVVHEYTEPISGEAWEGGPLIVSWDDARGGAGDGGHAFNVVIHEFTHKIDMLDGEPDGMPPFDSRTHPDLDPRAWRRSLDEAYARFAAELDLIEAELPPDVDADSPAADAWFASLPLDPYAALDEGEFFAVSSESFFVDPARLFEAFPDWYRQLALFFKQDPLAP
jgi:Mlc titration factor MtfA (ptsG expression regulator)